MPRRNSEVVDDYADLRGEQIEFVHGSLLLRLQAKAVDTLKRRAIARLHRHASGEALLLEIYLWAEEAAGSGAFADLKDLVLPPWLRAKLEHHASDENRHAMLLRKRLADLGVAPRPPRVDSLSRWKLGRLRQLVECSASSFRSGLCVTGLTLAWRMELMGVRVLTRHVDVLRSETASFGSGAALRVLEQILRDERAHARACETSLNRLVAEDEREALASLAGRIDAQERRFGITGALMLLGVAYAPSLAGPRVAVREVT